MEKSNVKSGCVSCAIRHIQRLSRKTGDGGRGSFKAEYEELRHVFLSPLKTPDPFVWYDCSFRTDGLWYAAYLRGIDAVIGRVDSVLALSSWVWRHRKSLLAKLGPPVWSEQLPAPRQRWTGDKLEQLPLHLSLFTPRFEAPVFHNIPDYLRVFFACVVFPVAMFSLWSSKYLLVKQESWDPYSSDVDHWLNTTPH